MKTQFLPAVVLWLGVAVLAAPPCSAQARGTVELSPVVGIYLPSAQLPPLPTPSVS